MTKADLVEGVYERIGFSKREAAQMVELVFELIREALERGENVKISRFGSFVVREKRRRRGRNPRTGEEIFIAPRRSLTFKTSPTLRKSLNPRAPSHEKSPKEG